jgi:hypothetical protein
VPMMTTIASEAIAQLYSLNHTQYLSPHCQGDANRTLFEDVNEAIGCYYLWSLLIVTHPFIFTTLFRLNRHIRHLSCINRKDRRYFTVTVPIINWYKYNIIYTLFLFHRRASKARLSENFTFGNLLTRL